MYVGSSCGDERQCAEFQECKQEADLDWLSDQEQVPYKTILRNLRNILKADLDAPTLKKVIETIKNPKKV
jgi:hypothetical protein